MNAPIPLRADDPPINKMEDAAALILFSVAPARAIDAAMAASRGTLEASSTMLYSKASVRSGCNVDVAEGSSFDVDPLAGGFSSDSEVPLGAATSLSSPWTLAAGGGASDGGASWLLDGATGASTGSSIAAGPARRLVRHERIATVCKTSKLAAGKIPPAYWFAI